MTADMGEISVDFELENPVDRELFQRGFRDESSVRRTRVRGIVDTGAMMLVLPGNIVERLGLRIQETVVVTYADNRKEERPVAGPVTVRIGNRSTRTDRLRGRPAFGRGPDRPDHPRGPRPDRRLHEPHADAADAGLPGAEAQAIPQIDRRSPRGPSGTIRFIEEGRDVTELLKEAFAKVARLPDHEQDAFARWLLDELESERRWSRAFETAQDRLAELAREPSKTSSPVELNRSPPTGCDVASYST